MSQRSDARGNPAAISTRLALRTCSMVATRTANLSRCVLRCRGSRWANSALIPSAQTVIPSTCVTAQSHAANHTGSVHHIQLQPSTYHHGKLMDGEGPALGFYFSESEFHWKDGTDLTFQEHGIRT